MADLKQDFFRYVCQTSPEPMALDIVRAEGPYLITRDGRRYLDLLAGIGVANIGHGREEVRDAITAQANAYLHPMVYGELIMEPQVRYARRLADILPGEIDVIYFVNSGAEAVEGALKTARKFTGRQKLFSFDHAYHGDTFGALSCQSEPLYRRPYEPAVPDIHALRWNDISELERIDCDTAGVILEPVQGEGGVRIPDAGFMRALRERCTEVGALLIFDEVMTGFGRTGRMFALEHWSVVPDIVVMAKALGGGLPLGAFAGPRHIMQCLSNDPPLAHVTTFGGNPVSCAAGLAALDILQKENLPVRAEAIGEALLALLQSLCREFAFLKTARGLGCLLALEFHRAEDCRRFTSLCMQNGVILGWTLFRDNVIRLAPPLILQEAELQMVERVFREVCQDIAKWQVP